MAKRSTTSRLSPVEVATINQIVGLYPGVQIAPTDAMRKTAPFSKCYLPKPGVPRYIFTEDKDVGFGMLPGDELKLVAGGISILPQLVE